MKQNLEIHEFMNMLEDFFESESHPIFDIGEIVGCNLLRYVAEIATSYVPFNNILFVMGCADSAYAMDRPNAMYWKLLFNDFMVEDVHNAFDPLAAPTFRYNKPAYEQRIIEPILHGYSVIIINQAQLIPPKYMDMITKTFQGQIVRIYDPFDIMYDFNGLDVALRCLDTFEKLPMTIAFARSLYGVETRSIDKRAKNSLVSGIKIKRRSVGRIDSCQYVTNDCNLLRECWEKQLRIQVRKNQRVSVLEQRFNIVEDPIYSHPHSLSSPAILHILQGREDGSVSCRLHSSKAEFNLKMTYEFKPFITPSNVLMVQPANIIPPDVELNNHYFKQIMYVTTNDEPLISTRDLYTLLKQSQNLIIAKTK